MIDLEHEQAHLLLRPLAVRDVDARWHDRGDAAVDGKDRSRLKIDPTYFATRRVLNIAAYRPTGPATRNDLVDALARLGRMRKPRRIGHGPADDLLTRDSGCFERPRVHLDDFAIAVEKSNECIDGVDDLGQPLLARPQPRFPLLALGHVARGLGGTDQAAHRIAERRNGQRDINRAAGLCEAHGLERSDDLSFLQAIDDVVLLLLPVGRDQAPYRMPYDLLRGVAEQLLGALIPAGDSSVEGLADDRVIGGADDRRHPGAELLQFQIHAIAIVDRLAKRF